MTNNIIRILVVEKSPALRAGLCSFLAATQSNEVVGETDNYENLPSQIEQVQPHIIFLDHSFFKIKNKKDEVWESIYSGKSKFHIVVMVDEYDLSCLVWCLINGARGVVTKNINAQDLEQVVRQVMQQQRYISPMLVDRLVDHLCEQKTFVVNNEENSFPVENSLTTVESLTDREREVLSLVAQGLSNKKIAEYLSLSIGAVKFHLSNVLNKLYLENRVQAALFALGQFPVNGHQEKQPN